MAQAIILPKLGQQTEEATILRWRKREGDPVKKGDVLFEMETDKAVLEAESFFEGTLLKILIPENRTVPVNTLVGFVGEPGERVPDAPPPAPAAVGGQKPLAQPQRPAAALADVGSRPAAPLAAPSRAERTSEIPELQTSAVPAPLPAAPAPARRLFISPRARALAEARCIDPSRITGSGPGGRIVERDVSAWLEANRYDEIRITPAAKRMAAQEKVDLLTVRGTGVGRRIMIHDIQRALAARPRQMNKMRQIIARRLTQSFTTTPHFYATTSVDMTDLLTWRQELKNRGEAYKVTDFILEAVVLALQEFPLLNSVAEGNTIRWRENVDLGLAVGLDDGLVVPVIWSAETLSLRELAETAAALAEKARAGKLLPDQMSGSSFTLSNMGMLDVENFSAIINPGESGILAVASTLATPVVRNGKIVVRSMMKITASVDHRIVDGAVAARFVNAIKAKLEDLELWKSLT